MQAGYIPENSLRALILAQIKPGCIIHLPCDFINPPHNKFIVVAHIDVEDNLLLAFFINSNIHQLLAKDPNLAACQIELKNTIYTIFDHDSFINCSQVVDEFELSYVINHLLDHRNDIRGTLREEEILEVIQAVRSAPTITQDDRNLITNSLGNL